MVHTIELIFDDETEVRVRQLWDGLAAAGIPSQAPASRPHVTLVAGDWIAADVDALLTPLARRMPLGCRIGAPVLFGRGNGVLARLVVPTTELLAVHADVYRICLPHLMPGPLSHTAPGQWTGHVTLARRIRPAQLGRALRIAGRPAEIGGSFAGLRRWEGDKRTEHLIS